MFPPKTRVQMFLGDTGNIDFIIESMDTPRETKDFVAWIMLVDWETFFWTLSFDVLWVSSFCSQFGSPWPVSCSVLVREQTATLKLFGTLHEWFGQIFSCKTAVWSCARCFSTFFLLPIDGIVDRRLAILTHQKRWLNYLFLKQKRKITQN